MKYEVIMFDADETLFDFEKSERTALRNTMLEFEIEYDENHHLQIYKEVNTAVWKEFEAGLLNQSLINTERFKRLSDRLKADFDEAKFSEAYIRHLAAASFLYDDSIPLIEGLHKDYTLTVVTNGLKEVQHHRVRKSSIGNYFKDVVISEEVEVSKPDPRIFELALSNIGHTDKSKVLMVGDSLRNDIQGGINFGVDTCWYNPGRIENTTGIRPTYEIHNLLELLDMLA